MSIFSFGNEKEKVGLVIDIGNSTVTTSLVSFNGSDLPLFLYSSNRSLDVTDRADSNRLIDSLISILESEMLKLSKEAFKSKYWQNKQKKISGGLISFSSPWFALKTKHLNLINEKEFVVTEHFLNDVISKEEQVFKLELSSDKPNLFKVFEKNIVHTKINGYELGEIIGKKTKSLEAFLCLSAMDSSLSEKIENIVYKYTHIPKDSFKFYTFPVVSFSIIRDYFSAGNDFLIVDVSGDVTDITLVQDSVIKHNVSIPIGRNYIIRQISKNFDVSNEIAESMLHLFNENKSDETINTKIHDIISQIEPEWAIYIENALQELSPAFVLPSNLFLLANSDVLHIYTEYFKLQKTDATMNFRKFLNLNTIDGSSMSKFIKNESGSYVDEFISFCALFYRKVFTKK